MDIKSLKRHLFENNGKVKIILEELGLHHIKLHKGSSTDDYYTAANCDGNNPTAITVYSSESLLCINYTRQISPNKNNSDLLDLVMFCRQENLFESLKWISETIGFDYYHSFKDDMPESLRILKQLKEMLKREESESDEDKTPIKQRPEVILSYYFPNVSQMFADDGIPFGVQREWEMGYDAYSNRWVIPIRDEIGNLVGVKGRYFNREVPEGELKYYYLEPAPKGRLLFGYHKTKDYINNSDIVYVVESEKNCIQFWSYGIRNVVGTGGTHMSQQQIENLSRLNKKLVLVFDRDFTEEKIQNLRNKFLPQIDFSAVIDKDNLLGEKESPSDKKDNLIKLLNNNIYKIDWIDKENR